MKILVEVCVDSRQGRLVRTMVNKFRQGIDTVARNVVVGGGYVLQLSLLQLAEV